MFLPLLSVDSSQHQETSEVDEYRNKSALEGDQELILLADDSPEVLSSGAAVLERLNYRVLKATDGSQAKMQFLQHRDEIALAILDVVMPEMSGVEVAELLRSKLPELPVIFLTGYDKGEAAIVVESVEHAVLLEKPPTIQR